MMSFDWQLMEPAVDSDYHPGPLVSHSLVMFRGKVYAFAGGNGKVANNKLSVFDCGTSPSPRHDYWAIDVSIDQPLTLFQKRGSGSSTKPPEQHPQLAWATPPSS